MIELRLPEFAASGSSTRLGTWLKREGESIKAGEPLVEIETDKTSVEVEAPAAGVLLAIRVPAGTDGLKAGALLALISAEGTPPSEEESSGKGGSPDAALEGGPAASKDAIAHAESMTVDARSASAACAVPISPSQSPAHMASVGQAAATPLARRMAIAAGLDWTTICGTAPGGRVRKADVERAIREARSYAPGITALLAPSPSGEPAVFQERSPSAMHKTTATRLLQAKQTIPHFYLRVDCAADAVLSFRARLNACQPEVKIKLTDIFVRVVALALRRVPQANSTWAEAALRVYETVDVSVAVNGMAGFITPVVRQADRKGLALISQELRASTQRARAGKLQPEECTGGTVSLFNLGMYGVESLYAIVDPAQSCILGVGAATDRAVVRDGGLQVGRVLTCTLSADHRAIDGATGAKLLAEVQRLIEEPGLLAL